jgi:hypothetical protein
VKATLEFNLPEDQYEFDNAVQGRNVKLALWDVHDLIFRAARKHGYVSSRITAAVDEMNTALEPHGLSVEEFVGLLEESFHEILEGYSVELD